MNAICPEDRIIAAHYISFSRYPTIYAPFHRHHHILGKYIYGTLLKFAALFFVNVHKKHRSQTLTGERMKLTDCGLPENVTSIFVLIPVSRKKWNSRERAKVAEANGRSSSRRQALCFLGTIEFCPSIYI